MRYLDAALSFHLSVFEVAFNLGYENGLIGRAGFGPTPRSGTRDGRIEQRTSRSGSFEQSALMTFVGGANPSMRWWARRTRAERRHDCAGDPGAKPSPVLLEPFECRIDQEDTSDDSPTAAARRGIRRELQPVESCPGRYRSNRDLQRKNFAIRTPGCG
ncbi:MAG TPA: hypothetical protein VHO06_28250 [Polyangia bacterium]|nr:hypothetical protein [Polyangia bacterium]